MSISVLTEEQKEPNRADTRNVSHYRFVDCCCDVGRILLPADDNHGFTVRFWWRSSDPDGPWSPYKVEIGDDRSNPADPIRIRNTNRMSAAEFVRLVDLAREHGWL